MRNESTVPSEDKKVKRVQYQKTGGGAVVVSVKETNPPETNLEKVDALFDLFGFHGWEGDFEQLVASFDAAIDELIVYHNAKREHTIREHASRNWVVRTWREFRGYREPAVVTRDQVVRAMAAKLRHFAAWVIEQRNRPFYAGSDLSRRIDRPLAVALRIELSQEKK